MTKLNREVTRVERVCRKERVGEEINIHSICFFHVDFAVYLFKNKFDIQTYSTIMNHFSKLNAL